MSNNISLKEVLNRTPDKEENRDCRSHQDRDSIPLPYLNALNELVGAQTAINVVQEHTLDDLLKGVEILDKFGFKNPPKTAKGKLSQVLKILKWGKELDSFESRDYYLETLTTTFSGFERLNERLLAEEDKRTRSWFFFRDVLTGVTRNLLTEYGTPVTKDNRTRGHIGQAYSYSSPVVLEGLPTDDLVNYLIQKELAGETVDEYCIKGGFDDPITAMLMASRTRGDHGRMANLYVRLGLTSLHDVMGFEPKDLKKLDNLNFKGDFNSGTYHELHFDRFIVRYVKGSTKDVSKIETAENLSSEEKAQKIANIRQRESHGRRKRLEKVLSLAQNEGAANYLFAFDGSIDQAQRVYKLSEVERPSAASIKYARKYLGQKQFSDVVSTAKEIDSPALAFFNEIPNRDEVRMTFDESSVIKDKEKLLTLIKQYEDVNSRYKEVSGQNRNLSVHDYELVQGFEGDDRYFRDFGLDSLHEAKRVNDAMDFETYDSLNIDSKSKASFVYNLLEKGYSPEEIQEVFTNGKHKTQKLEKIIKGFKSATLPLVDVAQIAQTGVWEEYAIEMVNEVPFKELGLPYGLLQGFAAHQVTPQQLNAFGDAVGFEQYKSGSAFKAIELINDFRTFYNKAPEQAVEASEIN